MPFFNPKFKLPLHITQLILIIIVIGLSAPRLFMKDQPRTRANTIALGMGAKSLIVIQYQLLTEHVRKLHKWASLKAFAILNGLEIVFWAAVVFLVIQANISICVGIGCTLSWIVVGFAIVLTILAVFAFGITFLEWGGARSICANSKEHRLDHVEGGDRTKQGWGKAAVIAK